MGDYNFEGFYNGGISAFDPDYMSEKNGVPGIYTGYRMNAYRLGFPGSTQTANQLTEAVNAIKQGVTAFEVTLGDANTAEQIPKQHFDEIRALMKITGVTPSVHAPFNVDPAGIGGGERSAFDESTRKENERRLFETLEKAKMLNPEGNTTVVFHPTAIGTGTEYAPGKDGEDRFQTKKIILIDQETGQMAIPIKEDVQYNPFNAEQLKDGGSKLSLKTKEDVDDRVFMANETQWDKQMNTLNVYKKEADEIIGSIEKPQVIDALKNKSEEELNKLMKEDPQLAHEIQDYKIKTQRVASFLDNNRLAFVGAFDNAYKYGSEKQKEELENLSKRLTGMNKEMREADEFQQQIIFSKIIDTGIAELKRITTPRGVREGDEVVRDDDYGAPKQFVPVEDFTRKKASETFSNLAFKSFSELGKGDASKAPVIAIENLNQMGYAKPEDFKKVVDESRNKFAKMLIDSKGMKENEANEVAQRMIGVTWDVGHINMLKKEGFTDEDIVKATKEIAPYVKHVHVTDNFGYSDSHLAPGMGNVPFKEILKELEKNGKLNEISKIVEAPGFVQHFKKSPHGLTLAAFGSPLYGPKMAPYWNQVAGMASGGGYFGSPLAMMPDKHFSLYGSGFSSLPMEVGGQIPGTGSRFSGTPNA